MPEPAFLVRGSSRRIMSMRFRPANIRVINRRDDHLDHHLCCWPLDQGQQHRKAPALNVVDASSHISRTADDSWVPGIATPSSSSTGDLSFAGAHNCAPVGRNRSELLCTVFRLQPVR